LVWRFASGPFWLGANSDPAYQYLINALYLADHRVPLYFQHPGTTLQLVGEGIIKAFNLFTGDTRMVENVFRAPEFYLHAMYAVLIIFYAVTMIALGLYAYRRSGDLTFACLVQAPAFLFLTMCKESGFLLVPANVCPETLLLGLLNLYGICLLRAFFMPDKKSSLWTALGWGAVYGLMVATKFTSLSLLVIPLALLPALRARLFFCLTAAAAFALATLPVWSRYASMWGNLYQMLTHTQFRGYGPQGLIAWDSFRNGLVITFVQQWLLMSSVFLILAIVLYQCIVLGVWNKLNKAHYWAVWIGMTIILQFLMVAKETAYHYMVPAMGLFGFLWAMMYWAKTGKPFVWRAAGLFFIVISLILCCIDIGYAYRSSSRTQAFSKEVYKHNRSVICGYYRCSSLPFSLAFGDDCYGLGAYRDLIQKLYPMDYVMDILQFQINNPQGGSLEDAISGGQQVFLYGSTLTETFFNPLFKVQLVAQSGEESVYAVLQAHDGQAFKLFYMAQMAMAQGQPQAAYMLGTSSKELGLPIARDFVANMDRIIADHKHQ
jgi:hypothetical protein